MTKHLTQELNMWISTNTPDLPFSLYVILLFFVAIRRSTHQTHVRVYNFIHLQGEPRRSETNSVKIFFISYRYRQLIHFKIGSF